MGGVRCTVSAVSAELPVSASAMRSSPAYYESALPGKGCGVLAARQVCPGELLLAESPLIVVPWWVRHSMFPGKEKKDFLDRAVRELSTEQRKGFYNLTTQRSVRMKQRQLMASGEPTTLLLVHHVQGLTT